MSQDYRIITHAGKAHMDDLCASALVCIYMKQEPKEILRIENREVDRLLEEGKLLPGDWVLDCGCKLDPEKKLYDHHQDRDMDSTALLVFDQLFPDLHHSKLHDSLKLLSKVDTQGAQSLNDFDKLDESQSYYQFSQKLLLKGFEIDPITAVRLVSEALQDSIEFDRKVQEAREWLQNQGHIEVKTIEGIKVLSYLSPPPEELAAALRVADKDLVDNQEIAAVYSFDEKTESGRALFRTLHGQNLLDFSRSKPMNLQFCHPAGFLMKFTPHSEKEWEQLIKESIFHREN